MKERIRKLDGHGGANGKPLRLVAAALIVRPTAGPTAGQDASQDASQDGCATEVLVCQLRPDRPMGLKWEFPGGKIEPGETAEQALARELEEELGIHAVIGRRIAQIRHRYSSGGALDLQFFLVEEFSGEPVNRIFNAIGWATLSALPTFDFLAADHGLVRDLAQGKLLQLT